MKRLGLFIFGLAIFAPMSVSAHHSLSAYNRSLYKTIEGTVRSFEWTNPHAHIVLLVPSSDGSSTTWNFEGGGVNRLVNGGLSKSSITPGDKIKVAFNPRRDTGPGGFFLAVTTQDGHTYGAERLRSYPRGESEN